MFIDKGAPVLAYRFGVVIISAGIPNVVDLEFQSVSGLKMNRNIVRNGPMTSLDGQVDVQTLILKRGVFRARSLLTVANALESSFWQTRLLRKDILVSVLDENKMPSTSWVVSNAYLESWEWGELSGSSNDVLIESMSFKYTGIKYKSL